MLLREGGLELCVDLPLFVCEQAECFSRRGSRV